MGSISDLPGCSEVTNIEKNLPTLLKDGVGTCWMGLGWVYLIPTGWKQEKQNGFHLNVLVHSASKTQARLWVSKVLFYELVFFFGINRFILQKT